MGVNGLGRMVPRGAGREWHRLPGLQELHSVGRDGHGEMRVARGSHEIITDGSRLAPLMIRRSASLMSQAWAGGEIHLVGGDDPGVSRFSSLTESPATLAASE